VTSPSSFRLHPQLRPVGRCSCWNVDDPAARGNDPEKLGTQLGGSRRTAAGFRFTCAFEYTDFPVTMVLYGPNEDSTVSLCQTLAFLDLADMRFAIANL